MRVVLDTNVLLPATLWDLGVSHKLLLALISFNVEIFSSPSIISEYRRVLKRDFDYDDGEISSILDKVLSFATIIVPRGKIGVVKDDPSDNMVLECAIDSGSDYIITYDRHLLSIGSYKKVRITGPRSFLGRSREINVPRWMQASYVVPRFSGFSSGIFADMAP